MDESILEFIENEVKSNSDMLKIFEPKKYASQLYLSSSEINSYYPLKDEFSFEYSLFKLYCFFDYTIDDIYDLLVKLGYKYSKSGLGRLVYSDFIQYTENHNYISRKDAYLKTTNEYKKKVDLKNNAESGNLENLVKDYEDTVKIIECLNDDMKFLCNDEDISPEKRISNIDKYSKISIRLNEKRFNLLEKIRAERL